MPYISALFVALLIVGGTEWSTDEDMVTMLTIIVASAAWVVLSLGSSVSRAWLWG